MSRYSALIVIFALGFLMFFVPAVSQAQEQVQQQTQKQVQQQAPEQAPAQVPQPAAEEEVEYSYGKVISVAADQIVVREYDYDKDTEVDVTYMIDAGTVFENVGALKDIAVDDIVEIDYVVKDSKNIAKNIIVEKMLEETGEESVYPEEDITEENLPAEE